MDSSSAAYRPTGVLFGAAYYAEYHVSERLDLDLDLMKAAGFTVIRVGESVWSTWEPRDGEFDLEWLQPVLDGALARGIRVILGTPTYAVPPWLQVAHPEIAAERKTGQRVAWGARQEIDFSHPVFRVMPSGSFARFSIVMPATRRSSGSRSTTSPGMNCSTTSTCSRSSAIAWSGNTGTWKR